MKTLFQTLSLIGISLLLGSCQPESPEIDLTGNRWQLVKFKGSNTSCQKAEGDYFLEFVNDSLFSILLDVNECFGKYSLPENGMIEVEEAVLCTKVCCDTDNAEAFYLTFVQMNTYYGQGDKLVFEGAGKVVFVPEE